MSTPRPCQVCQHPDRAAIDQALLNGKGQRDVARSFGIGSGEFGTDTFRPDHKKVHRHVVGCMGEAYRAARVESTVEAGNALVRRMEHLDAVVDETLGRLREGVVITDEHGPMLGPNGAPLRRYNDSQILAAIREARRNVEMHARLAGVMPEGDDTAADAARLALQSPEARRAVADLEDMLHRAARSPEQG